MFLYYLYSRSSALASSALLLLLFRWPLPIRITIHIIISATRFTAVFSWGSYIIFNIIDRLSITEPHELINHRRFSFEIQLKRVVAAAAVGLYRQQEGLWPKPDTKYGYATAKSKSERTDPAEHARKRFRYVYIYHIW